LSLDAKVFGLELSRARPNDEEGLPQVEVLSGSGLPLILENAPTVKRIISLT
jgi:hypothetical protein